ncbi:MAG: hypothetical protein IT439_11845 [Phycisphaerales bacterium]|nr:hypothetical protein [Phycisphaerales bacterium]
MIDQNLLAYRDVMSHYVLLIRQMQAAHAALQQAVMNPEIVIPSPVRIIETVIALRQAFAVYEKSN